MPSLFVEQLAAYALQSHISGQKKSQKFTSAIEYIVLVAETEDHLKK